MLDVAESITTLIEAEVWTTRSFPVLEEVERRFGASHAVMRGAIRILVSRGVVALQADPASGSHKARHLPAPPPGIAVAMSTPERIIATVTARIESGEYTVDCFPTMEQMIAEFKCGTNTMVKAMQLGKARGVLHKVRKLRPAPGRGVMWIWRPVEDDVAAPESDLVQRLTTDIEAGTLTGPVKSVNMLARRYRVNDATMREAFTALVEKELLRRVWLPDWSARVWYVIDGKQPGWLPPGDGTRAVAIAADLARRLPQWLSRDEHGRLVRRPLPPREKLRQQYRTHWFTMQRALELLIVRKLLERVEVAGKPEEYVPVPPEGRPEGAGHRAVASAAIRAKANWRDPGRFAERMSAW